MSIIKLMKVLSNLDMTALFMDLASTMKSKYIELG